VYPIITYHGETEQGVSSPGFLCCCCFIKCFNLELTWQYPLSEFHPKQKRKFTFHYAYGPVCMITSSRSIKLYCRGISPASCSSHRKRNDRDSSPKL